ncbi:MAG: TonB-dependent receptor [Proteobacteria bacterium]|nr:TonB-dependent receptor [Pseudomonadota bacterium]
MHQPRVSAVLSLWCLLVLGAPAAADPPPERPPDPSVEELVVEGRRIGAETLDDPFEVLPTGPLDSVFGLNKSVLDTPRSVATVGERMLHLYGVESVDDFATVTPGTHRSSFFGISASPDIRGTIADLYFRGVRRLVNAGGWPTLIGASQRVDIVRGPASPIHGPGSISGYLNFVPKTARAGEDQFLDSAYGELSVGTGSWSHAEIEGQIGGPATLFGRPAGYQVFGFLEDSGRYYDDVRDTEQAMLQSSLVLDLTGDVWIEVGQQYQRWRGAEVAGWNRIDQTLIDTGRYLAGAPRVDLDGDGDGRISQAEVGAVSPRNLLGIFTPFGSGEADFDSPREREALRLDPASVRRVEVGTDDCICSPDDDGGARSHAFYFDVFASLGDGLDLRQMLFFDYADRFIEVDYGFSQRHESLLVEERVELSWSGVALAPSVAADFVFSPSLRYYDTRARQDFSYEYFDRRDITRPASALDRRVSSHDDPRGNPFNRDVRTESLNLGLAALADVTLFERVSLLGGLRWDRFDVRSKNGPDILEGDGQIRGDRASTVQNELSWNLSLTLKLGNWRPYATYARQAVPLGGQSGEIEVSEVRRKPLNASELKEIGLKYVGLGGRLFAHLDYYEQKRTDYTSFTNENLAVLGKGTEFELRVVPNDRWVLLLNATFSKVLRDPLSARFIFAPPSISGFAPEDQYGGSVFTVLPAGDRRFRDRGALPDRVFSVGASYRLTPALGVNVTATRASSHWSGVGRSVRLPGYTLVNATLSYERGGWSLDLSLNNAFDEVYFQGNFPEIFGDVIVLPQRPRNWHFGVTRHFGDHD